MNEIKTKIRKYLPEGTKALKNIGFSSPERDIIDAPYEVLGVFTKKDKYGNVRTWVPLVIHETDKDLSAMFEGCILAGLESSPVKEDRGIDESLYVTWTSGNSEPAFKKGI